VPEEGEEKQEEEGEEVRGPATPPEQGGPPPPPRPPGAPSPPPPHPTGPDGAITDAVDDAVEVSGGGSFQLPPPAPSVGRCMLTLRSPC